MIKLYVTYSRVIFVLADLLVVVMFVLVQMLFTGQFNTEGYGTFTDAI